MKKFDLFINNEWRESSNREYITSYCPATGEPIAMVADATKQDVNDACTAARNAFNNGWADMDPHKRSDLILKAASIMKRREKELAEYEALDTGKPISEAAGFDIPFSIYAFEYFANLAREVQGHVIPIKNGLEREIFDFVTYEPYGVVAVISPFNYPLHLLTRSLCPALAAGNTVICKASKTTPVTTSILGEIFLEAGFPPGVVNIISGSGEVAGDALSDNKDVDIIAFTGSESVGRKLMEASSRSQIMKKLLLELGGKGAAIVEPDCDVESTVNSLVLGLCSNQGEVCCAISRVYIHEKIYDQFLEQLAAKMNTLKAGDILDPQTQIGSLISKSHLMQVDNYVKQAIKEGARLLCGGEKYTEAPCDKGHWYKPTILDNVKQSASCVREEIFGPVMVVEKYSELQDAIDMANATDFGLGANIFTLDYRVAYWASRKLNVGTVWVNMPNGSQMNAPFGGNKNSGMGREYGIIGLHEYLKIKNNMWNMSKEPFSYY